MFYAINETKGDYLKNIKEEYFCWPTIVGNQKAKSLFYAKNKASTLTIVGNQGAYGLFKGMNLMSEHSWIRGNQKALSLFSSINTIKNSTIMGNQEAKGLGSGRNIAIKSLISGGEQKVYYSPLKENIVINPLSDKKLKQKI